MTIIADAMRQLAAENGWKPGTFLENKVALCLTRYRTPGPAEQQYQAGKFRLDFAWPSIKIAIEADGWWHRSPEGAARDAERDSWLRNEGWLVFRVDDRYGEESLERQIIRVSRIVRREL